MLWRMHLHYWYTPVCLVKRPAFSLHIIISRLCLAERSVIDLAIFLSMAWNPSCDFQSTRYGSQREIISDRMHAISQNWTLDAYIRFYPLFYTPAKTSIVWAICCEVFVNRIRSGRIYHTLKPDQVRNLGHLAWNHWRLAAFWVNIGL